MSEKNNDLWFEYVNELGLCGLCSNSGILGIQSVSPTGIFCFITAHCICPNGRRLKEFADKKLGKPNKTSLLNQTYR